jgi:hypothetical protein
MSDTHEPNKDTITRRVITPEVKIINAKEGTVDYIASDQTVDCYNEVVLASGWRFNLFSKNAPFVDSHNYWSIDRVLGRVESWEVKGKKLVERVRWAIDSDVPLAKLGFELTEKGYLKAVSVGFFARRWATSYGDASMWEAAVKEAGLSKDDLARCRVIFLEHEQVELSACIIGANPNALAKAYKDGALKDEGLRTLGLDSAEGVEFLQRAGAAVEREDLDPLMRSVINLELQRSYQFAKGSPSAPQGKHTASPTGKPGGVDEAQRRAAEGQRAEFLKQLAALTPANRS